jgi:hypothetical protein
LGPGVRLQVCPVIGCLVPLSGHRCQKSNGLCGARYAEHGG